MTWSVTADVERFDEAMEWFEERVPVTPEQLEQLTATQRERAITIAAITEANVVADLLSEIERAAVSGEGIGVFRKRAKARMGSLYTSQTAARIDTAMITTTQTALNAGRYKQLTDPDVMRTRQFWMFDAVMDDRTTHICQSLEGTTLPADDPQWGGIHPPMHHRCRSGIRSQRRRVVERRGGPTKPEDMPEVNAPEGFGKLPTAAPWKPKKGDYPEAVFKAYQRKRRAVKAKVKRDATKKAA